MWKSGLFCFFVCQLVILPSSISPFSLGQSDHGDSELGLYNSSDHVVSLNKTNFQTIIYGNKRAWLVEFYNSWCGFCVRFAPLWKGFAKRVHSWNNIVTIAAVDCANSQNHHLCRDYDITMFPTLKFFSANAHPGNHGLVVKKSNDETSLVEGLTDILETEQLEGRGINWPNLVPIRGNDLSNLWRDASENIRFQFIIFEEPKSRLGATVILDLNRISSIKIRRVLSSNEPLCIASKVHKFPFIILLNRDGSQHVIEFPKPTSDSFIESIKNFLQSKGIATEIKIEDFESNIVESRGVKGDVAVYQPEDKLFEADLLSAIHYSLYRETQFKKNITGNDLVSLKHFLKVLAKYFPARSVNGKKFFVVLEKLVANETSITSKKFKESLVKAEEYAPGYVIKREWICCKNYPCGLWLLFHALTVEAANDENFSDSQHSSVLRAIHGYVKNFFGCAHCSEHFVTMAANRKLFDVKEGEESVLWLWRAHNEVNERLAEEEALSKTENKNRKKIQYPSVKSCPTCKTSNNTWIESEVIRFLKMKYGKNNIDHKNVKLNNQVTAPLMSKALDRRTSWDFTLFDISICVVLYVISAGILVLVCIKFAVKRTHKRKMSISHMFGTV